MKNTQLGTKVAIPVLTLPKDNMISNADTGLIKLFTVALEATLKITTLLRKEILVMKITSLTIQQKEWKANDNVNTKVNFLVIAVLIVIKIQKEDGNML